MKYILFSFLLALSFTVNAQNIIGQSSQSTATERNNARLIVEDNSGRLHVVYYNNGIYYSFSETKGLTWSTPFLIDEIGRNPSLVIDSNNILHLVYKNGGISAFDIVYRKFSNSEWSAAEIVYHDEITNISRPVLAIDANGALHCVWQRAGFSSTPNSEIWYCKRDQVNGWQTAVNVSNSYGASEYPTLTTDLSNNIHVFWKDSGEDIGNDKMVLYRKFTVGFGWDLNYTNLSNTTGNGSSLTMDPCAVTDIQGNIHLVWKDNQTGVREIYYKKCTNGTWDSNFTNISNSMVASSYPSISTDTQGNLFVFWSEKIGGVYFETVYKKFEVNLNSWSEMFNVSNSASVDSNYPNAPSHIKSKISLIWTEGESSPYSIFCYTQMLPSVYSISGTIEGDDNPGIGISGLIVQLSGDHNYEATTLTNGIFTFPAVLDNNTYTLTITKSGYEPYISTVIMNGENVDLGTIILNELRSLPYDLQINFDGLPQGQAAFTWSHDNMKKLSVNNSKSFIGFNIYLNDTTYGNQLYAEITNNHYLFTNLVDGNYIAGVSCVYSSGETEIVTIPFTVILANVSYLSEKVYAYPNPVSSNLILETENSNDNTMYEILNLNSLAVLKGNFVGRTCIQTTSFASGIYFIKFWRGNDFELIKIIKK
ncbi:MAG: T9SS type A sorting domain-containing protein [Salinivirgaceae bacterium]|nr:T9SS type A sorting domain-containing protein [Salinivirgaceae bacterium]MDD4746777.1 T9SS type A sorting domain-containing protein [Salinivirgaceae bacterium]